MSGLGPRRRIIDRDVAHGVDDERAWIGYDQHERTATHQDHRGGV
jgi:hypothetical protein